MVSSKLQGLKFARFCLKKAIPKRYRILGKRTNKNEQAGLLGGSMKRFVAVLVAAIAQLWLPAGTILGSRGEAFARDSKLFTQANAISIENRKRAEDLLDVGDDYAGARPQSPTKYPIVLVHGFMGWDKIFFFDYFYHVRKTLEAEGFTVFVPHVNPVTSIEVRGTYLATLIDDVLAQTGAEKVNIIAHSMGGLDARYVAGKGYANKIASITTIGTPHQGTPVPDFVFKFLGKNDNILYKAFEYLVAGFLGEGKFGATDLDIRDCLWNLSPSYINGYFNPNFPIDPGIYTQSYAGVSSITGWSTGDRMDALLMPFQPAFSWGSRNDGLVPLESAQWGRFRGIVSADHVNLVGQLFGNTSVRFKHTNFYKKIVYELVDLGF